jgi:hypothetical protein
VTNKVYANGMEIACKSSTGKSIAAFPDVCFTPPTAPPTPPGVPIPYPNTALASDTDGGSKTVKLHGKESMLKDRSAFKKSAGNEAGNAPKKGLITSTNKGKAIFNSYSMDVKIEGMNVPRHLDLMTHNHMQKPGNTGPWPFTGSMSPSAPDRPENCRLRPYKEGCEGKKTPHHCVPDHCFKEAGDHGTYYPGAVQHADGLCVCVKGATKSTAADGGTIKKADYPSPDAFRSALAQHGRIHAIFDKLEAELGGAGTPPNTAKLGDLEDAAASTIAKVTGCDKDDLKKQMRSFHESKGLDANTKLRADPSGRAQPKPPFNQMGSAKDAINGIF